MSIYNFSVLKSRPITIRTSSGVLTLYRIKFHGKETFPGLNCDWNISSPKYTCDIDRIKGRALRAWGGRKPEYGVDTSGYKGELDFNDPLYKDEFQVLQLKGDVAYQEDEGIIKSIGRIKKEGKNFIFCEEVCDI
jgi:hypothetical protein